MPHISESSKRLDTLTESHRDALLWFHHRQGAEVRWPGKLPDGTFLVNRAKGIHKPAGWRHALSVRQVLSSRYADREPRTTEDGTWTYAYYQEGEDPEDRDQYFTNTALLACRDDSVPIGVLRQTRDGKGSRYYVLGLALVRQWENGHFHLEGLKGDLDLSRDAAAEVLEFHPANLEDARRWTQGSIVRRRGQRSFRAQLIYVYDGQCAVTGCSAIEALEAARIVPYRGEQTNVPQNGLLLRADIHTLFDLGLISIDPATMSVHVHHKLAGTEYAVLDGKTLQEPQDPTSAPSIEALAEHNRWAQKPQLGAAPSDKHEP